MVDSIAFYALYKSRVLIIPCNADDFCLFIALPDEIKKKSLVIVIQCMYIKLKEVRKIGVFTAVINTHFINFIF